MLDLSFVRNNFDRVAERLATRGNIPSLDQFRELDRERRTAIFESETLKARKKLESAKVGKLSQQGVDTTERQKEIRAIDDEIAARDEIVKRADGEFQELLAGIPNIPHESVPVGRTADDNVEVRRFAEPPQFEFEPKAHW